MSDLQDALDQIKARAERATEGPWEISGSLIEGPRYAVGQAFGIKWRDDLDFIAHARTDVPRLVEAVETVLEKTTYMTRYAHGQDYWGGVRAASQEILAALNDELTGEDDG